jgi:hypothetical protein
MAGGWIQSTSVQLPNNPTLTAKFKVSMLEAELGAM